MFGEGERFVREASPLFNSALGMGGTASRDKPLMLRGWWVRIDNTRGGGDFKEGLASLLNALFYCGRDFKIPLNPPFSKGDSWFPVTPFSVPCFGGGGT